MLEFSEAVLDTKRFTKSLRERLSRLKHAQIWRGEQVGDWLVLQHSRNLAAPGWPSMDSGGSSLSMPSLVHCSFQRSGLL